MQKITLQQSHDHVVKHISLFVRWRLIVEILDVLEIPYIPAQACPIPGTIIGRLSLRYCLQCTSLMTVHIC